MQKCGLGPFARKICLGALGLSLGACGRAEFWGPSTTADSVALTPPDAGPSVADAGQAAPCVPINPCNLGTLSSPPGSATCTDTGKPDPAANGVSCGTQMVCSNGRCQNCAAGVPCAIGDCELGAISCATGSEVCESSGGQGASPDWSTCGDGGYCSGGTCLPFRPASHESFPLIPDQGGVVLATPALVTVTFRDYRFRSEVEALGTWIVGSTWLSAVGEDYGVGPGRSALAVSLDQDAPASVSSPGDIEAILDQGISSGSLPKPDAQTVYLLYFPAQTQVAFGGCQAFSGYHFWFAASGGARVVYGVVLDCAGGAIEAIEGTAAHELIEAATDPHPSGTGPPTAYAITGDQSAWADSVGGEVADLCAFTDHRDPASGFFVQGVWSNTAAAAGDRSPCIPAPEGPYFGVSASPAEAQTQEAGRSLDFNVTGWSTAPIPPWPVTFFAGGDFDAHPRLSALSIANGGTLTLTLTVPANAPSGSKGWALIESSNAAGQVESFWPVAVFAR